MKKFRFNLDSVLDYRQQTLDERKNEYGRALEKVRQQQARKEAAEARYRDMNQRFREEAAVGISCADAVSYEMGLRLLEQQIARETQLLQECRAAAEEKREEMMQAHVDTTVLERLREKKLKDYQSQLQKAEERFIDELVSAAQYGQNSAS
jgi:flagellar FliJ protein